MLRLFSRRVQCTKSLSRMPSLTFSHACAYFSRTFTFINVRQEKSFHFHLVYVSHASILLQKEKHFYFHISQNIIFVTLRKRKVTKFTFRNELKNFSLIIIVAIFSPNSRFSPSLILSHSLRLLNAPSFLPCKVA